MQSPSRKNIANGSQLTAPSNQKVTQAESKVNTKGAKLQIADEDSEGNKLSKEQVENDPDYTEEEKRAIFKFEEEIEKYTKKKLNPTNNVVVTEETSAILQRLGLKNLPIAITQSHLGNILHEENDKNIHYHGMETWEIANAPGFLGHPAMVIEKDSAIDTMIVVSGEVDHLGRPIIIALRPNGEAIIDMQYVDSNFIKSMYGRSKAENYFEGINKDEVLFIDQKKSL